MPTPRLFAAPRAVLLGALLVLVLNAAMLGAAAWNRAGAPRVALRLTERELELPAGRFEKNDEIFLHLTLGHEPPLASRLAAIRNRRSLEDDDIDWLDAAKLKRLGFPRVIDRPGEDVHAATSRDEGEANSTRRVFFAIEFEGEAWKHWLARAERRVADLRAAVQMGRADPAQLAEADALLAIDRVQRSRLFAVDADPDAEALERRLAGRPGVVVVPGLVGVAAPRAAARPSGVHGRIERFFPPEVHVPHASRPRVAPFLPGEDLWARAWRERDREGGVAWPAPAAPRFAATVRFGRARTPWIADLE